MDKMIIKDRKTGLKKFLIEGEHITDLRVPREHVFLTGLDTCARCGELRSTTKTCIQILK